MPVKCVKFSIQYLQAESIDAKVKSQFPIFGRKNTSNGKYALRGICHVFSDL